MSKRANYHWMLLKTSLSFYIYRLVTSKKKDISIQALASSNCESPNIVYDKINWTFTSTTLDA